MTAPADPLHAALADVEPAVEFVVVGTPAPQGSKNAHIVKAKTGKARAVVSESSKAVKPWRAAVAAAGAAAVAGAPPLDGPLVLDVVFTMPKPKSAPKTLRTLPATTPDLSKLLRSTEDGMVEARVIADDARIVAFRRLAKVYEADEHDPDSLPHLGAVIRVWHYPPALLPTTSRRSS